MYKVEIHKPTNSPVCSVYSPSPLFRTRPLFSHAQAFGQKHRLITKVAACQDCQYHRAGYI